jgi:hypothetical protein
MPVSILREPPRGSELAARVEAMNRDPGENSPLAREPVLVTTAEAYEVSREPRLWKLPAAWVARHYVPRYLALTAGSAVAARVQADAEVALEFACLLQDNDQATASAEKRAKEPAEDTPKFVMGIIYAEYQRVKNQLPDASDNRHFEVTGINLGGSREPIDRAAIRRAVEKFPHLLTGKPKWQVDAILWAVIAFGDIFRPGWAKTLH